MITSQTSKAADTISTLVGRAGEKIADAIKSASSKTGVDFSYLMQQAQVESSFKANAKSTSSSATGLYQFIDKTWLQMVNKYGDKHGLGDLAKEISDSGEVSSKGIKNQILALRNDPAICSLMAGELAAENKTYLENCTNGNVGSTELYMAHFMGAAGAAKFLNAKDKNGDVSAASLFPAAANANQNIFYTSNGNPRSLAQVYAIFDKKFQIESTSCSVTSTIPATTAIPTNTINTSALRDIPHTATSTIHSTTTKNKGDPTMTTASLPPGFVQSRTNRTSRGEPQYDATKNYGGIPGLQTPVILPVDILALMRTDDHSSNKRYNG